MSMYRQLWLAIVVSMLLALGGSLLVSLLSARGYLESQLSIKNTDNANALALSLSQGNPDAVMADLVVASLFDSGHYELIRIVSPAGSLITERVSDVVTVDAPHWFTRLLPISASPGIAQISSGWTQFGTVTLVSHSRFAYDALWASAYEMVIALSLAGLVGGLLSSLVLGRLRKPLNAVIAQARAITQRRFVTIAEPAVPELRDLAVAMNTTVGRLKGMFEEEASRLEHVRQEANCDPLTGLANRSYFMALLKQRLDDEDSGGGLLLMVRLANLAEVNKRMGRAATDDFVKAVAKSLQSHLDGASLSMGARLNGADFALLLARARNAETVAASLLQTLEQVSAPYVDGHASAWIGAGEFSQGESMGALLARLDFSLAAAEADHDSGFRIALQEVGQELPRSAEQWSSTILKALDQGWVRLISFPVVDGKGVLSHRECPLRLMFDEKGEWVAAGKFLPVAERLKLTSALDYAAVDLGLKELSAQSQLSGLAINLSASSLQDAHFIARLVDLIESYKNVASKLWLEVSEAGALQNLAEFARLCKSLKALDCRVGLEHYGHHFSQIGVLHELGLDYLKVDASFVRGVDANAGNSAFLKGLCSIAHNIGLQVFAEGVVAPAELATVLLLGFDGATGPAIREPS